MRRLRILPVAMFALQIALLGGISPVEAQESQLSATQTKHGSCFAVDPSGLILTAYHVIDGAQTLRVRLSDGSILDADVHRTAPNIDLALLDVHTPLKAFLPLAKARSAKIGGQVFTIGYPTPTLLGVEAKFTEGSISALSGPGGESTLLQISVPVQPGNSGGPLVNMKGEVVGVVSSTAAVSSFLKVTGTLPQNVNWAIKSDYVRPLFDKDPPVITQASGRDQAIERAQKAACLIEAYGSYNQPVAAAPSRSGSDTRVVVPAGTEVIAQLTEIVSTKKKYGFHVEQMVPARVYRDVAVDGKVVIEEGAPIYLRIVEFKRPKVAGIKGKLALKAEWAEAVDGNNVELFGTTDHKGQGNIALSASLAALVCWPCIFIHGGNATMPEGMVLATQTTRRVEVTTNIDAMPARVTKALPPPPEPAKSAGQQDRCPPGQRYIAGQGCW